MEDEKVDERNEIIDEALLTSEDVFSHVQFLHDLVRSDPTLVNLFELELSEELRKGNLDRFEYKKVQNDLRLITQAQILLSGLTKGKVYTPYFLYKLLYQFLILSGSRNMGFIKTLLTKFVGKHDTEEGKKGGLFRK